MKLLFQLYNPDRHSFWDWLIWEVTRLDLDSPTAIHVEVQLDNGKCFSSRAETNGVSWLPAIDAADPKEWLILDLDKLGCQPTQGTMDWANSILGAPYNYPGALASGFQEPFTLAGYWFCSQACSEFLSRCSPALLGIPPLLNPEDLLQWMKTLLDIGAAKMAAGFRRDWLDRVGRRRSYSELDSPLPSLKEKV